MCRGIYSPTASCSPQSHGLSSERGTRTVCTQSSLYTSNAPFLACPHNHQASLARGITKPPRWQAESARSQRTIHLIQLGHAGCEGRHRQLRVPEVEHHCILCFAKHIQGGVGDPAVARACVCRNTSERNITVMCTPQLWNTSRLKLTLHPNGPRGTTAIMTANRRKRFYPMNHVTNLPLGAGGPEWGFLGGQAPPGVFTGNISSIHSDG